MQRSGQLVVQQLEQLVELADVLADIAVDVAADVLAVEVALELIAGGLGYCSQIWPVVPVV